MRKSPVSGEKLATCRWIWTWTRLLWPMLSQTTHQPQCRTPPSYRHAAPAKPVLINTLPHVQWQGKHKFVVPKCTTPQSQKLYVVNNLQPFSSTSLPYLPLLTPPQHAVFPSSPLSVNWRLQKCTITGLTHITKDTSQLPQAVSISQIWFPFVQAMAFLLFPTPRAHPPPPIHNLYPMALPQVPRHRPESTDCITAASYGSFGQGSPSKGWCVL